MIRDWRTWIVPAYLLLCLLLGGASAGGFWANMLLQLLAIPIIGWALLEKRRTTISHPATQLLWLLLLVVCWPLALLALLLYPIVWLLLLPFRLVGIVVDVVVEEVLGDMLIGFTGGVGVVDFGDSPSSVAYKTSQS